MTKSASSSCNNLLIMMVLNEGRRREHVEEGSGDGSDAMVGLGGVDEGRYEGSEAENRCAM